MKKVLRVIECEYDKNCSRKYLSPNYIDDKELEVNSIEENGDRCSKSGYKYNFFNVKMINGKRFGAVCEKEIQEVYEIEGVNEELFKV